MANQGKQFIYGQWCVGEGDILQSINPATGEVIWEGRMASLKQVDSAVRAGKNAYQNWSCLSIEERCQYLEKFVAVIQQKREQYKKALAIEVGKPLWEADTEVGAVLNKLAISIEAYYERCPNKKQDKAGITSRLRHRPHGVVVVFGPFNFPLHLPNGHIMPALLAGNTVVLKPSENTPMVSELMVQAWDEAGLPAGVLNCVQGDAVIGKALADHQYIDGLFFTGSYQVGSMLNAAMVNYPNRILALEMGGNNPLVVHEIEDIDAAVYNTIQSAYITAGQRCTCARRLILTKQEKNQIFLEKLITTIEKIKVGTFTQEPEPFMGPVISNQSASHIFGQYQNLIAQGAKVLLPMQRLDPNAAFLMPGLLDVTEVPNRIDEEVFGPLLQVIWVNDFDAALTEANNTAYGLSAGLLSDHQKHYDKFLQITRAGIINWNRPLTGASSSSPFGGTGKSGNYRPSAYYAADYCAYPVSSLESSQLKLPEQLIPGIEI